MYTERMAIQDELHDNRRQIQDLRDRNGDLLKRLREIDERDMKDELSYDGLNSLTQSLTEILDKMADIIPHISPAAIIEHVTKNVDTSQVEVKQEKKPEPTKVEQVAQESKLHSKKAEKVSTERAASIIKEIIADSGEMKAKEIEDEFYKRTGKKYANFTRLLTIAKEKYPSIQKAGFGRYKHSKKEEKKNNMFNTSFKENKEIQTHIS